MECAIFGNWNAQFSANGMHNFRQIGMYNNQQIGMYNIRQIGMHNNTQAQLCELFQKSKATVSEHIRNIFEEGELASNSVVRNFRTTATDDKNYNNEIPR